MDQDKSGRAFLRELRKLRQSVDGRMEQVGYVRGLAAGIFAGGCTMYAVCLAFPVRMGIRDAASASPRRSTRADEAGSMLDKDALMRRQRQVDG